MRVSAACCMVLAVCLSGCGGGSDGPSRVDVSGQVTYQGKPIPRGQIRFVPTGPEGGPIAAVEIRDGKYAAMGETGVPVGTHRLEFLGFKIVGATSPADMVGAGEEQYIAEKHNAKSTHTLKVPAGSPPLTENFELD